MAASSLTVMVQLQDKVTGPARNATKSIDQVNAATKRATLGTNQYGKAVDGSTRGLSKFAKSGLQQAGYQVGDFAVQVGGGTSALQAFGQQGSQLLGIFGPLGAILGAGVAIVAAIGTAYQKSAGGASAFGDQAERLNTILQKQTVFGGKTQQSLEKLERQYGELTPSVMSFFGAQQRIEELRVKQEIRSTNAALREFSRDLKVAEKFTQQYQVAVATGNIVETARLKAVDLVATSVKDLSNEYGVQVTRVDDLRRALEGTTAQGATVDEKLKAITSALEIFGQRGSKATEQQDELREVLITLQEALMLTKNGADDVGDALQKMSAYEPDNFMEAMAFHEEAIRGVDEAMKQHEAIAQSVGKSVADSFGSSFKDVIMGTKRTSDAFSDMAKQIISKLYDVLVIQRIVGMVGTGGKGSGSGVSGAIADMFRADGGPVSGGKAYVVGERGPEMFIPGSSGTVIPNKNMTGGGGSTVVQNINISTGVSQTVRAEMVQLMPQIVNAAKSGVLDAKKRGGSYGAAF